MNIFNNNFSSMQMPFQSMNPNINFMSFSNINGMMNPNNINMNMNMNMNININININTASDKSKRTDRRPPLFPRHPVIYCANGKESYQRPEIRDIPPVTRGIVLSGQGISAAPPDEDYPDL